MGAGQRRASTSWPPSRRRCGGLAPTTSTSTNSTRPDPATPIDETLAALDDLVRSGKVRYVGCSNFLAYQVARALGRSEARSLVRFDSVQPRYNLLFRQIERELLPLCAEEGLGIIPYNPIAGGLLSGKHNPSAPPPEGTRFTLGQRRRRSTGAATGTTGSSPRWRSCARSPNVRASAGHPLGGLGPGQPGRDLRIIGASRPEQLDASLAAADFIMSLSSRASSTS